MEEKPTEGNSISDIRRFFETNETPLKANEFVDFWKALSDEDKVAFKKANLSS